MIVSKTEKKQNIARGIIAGGMARLGYEDADMQKILSVSHNTWQKYKKDPGTMSQSHIWILVDLLKLTPPQAASFALGRDLTADDFKQYVL